MDANRGRSTLRFSDQTEDGMPTISTILIGCWMKCSRLIGQLTSRNSRSAVPYERAFQVTNTWRRREANAFDGKRAETPA
jgi:hypothetical protein